MFPSFCICCNIERFPVLSMFCQQYIKFNLQSENLFSLTRCLFFFLKERFCLATFLRVKYKIQYKQHHWETLLWLLCWAYRSRWSITKTLWETCGSVSNCMINCISAEPPDIPLPLGLLTGTRGTKRLWISLWDCDKKMNQGCKTVQTCRSGVQTTYLLWKVWINNSGRSS